METSPITMCLHSGFRRLVERHLSDEAPFCDAVWDAFWGAAGCATLEELSGLHEGHSAHETIADLIRAAPGGDQSVRSLQLLSALTSVTIVKLASEGSDSDEATVFRNVLSRASLPQSVLEQLVAEGTAVLREALELRSSSDDQPHRVYDGASGSRVFVEQLLDGEFQQTKPYAAQEASRLIQTKKYDLIIHEPANLVRVGRKAHKLHRVGKRVRTMLWLVLTHLGRAVQHSEIDAIYYEGRKVDPSSYYHVNQVLKKFLGQSLHKRLVEEGGDEQYPIIKDRATFLWIREAADRNRSRLLHGLGRPVE